MNAANPDSDNVLKTGTTTIGMKIKDGIILATDQDRRRGAAGGRRSARYHASDRQRAAHPGLSGGARAPGSAWRPRPLSSRSPLLHWGGRGA